MIFEYIILVNKIVIKLDKKISKRAKEIVNTIRKDTIVNILG